MHLRHLVPALGILASTTGAAFAEDIGGLSVGGFVDTIGSASDEVDQGPGGTSYGFSSAVELRIGFKATDKVTAQIDAEWNNTGDATGAAARQDVYLEQAYVNYAFADKLSVTTGKFTTYAGWVSADADGLFRINGGPITGLYGGELVGAALNYAPSDELGVSFFLVNGLDLGEIGQDAADVSGDDSTNGNRDDYLSPAVDLIYKAKDIGTFNLEAGYDYISEDESIVSVGANATIKPAQMEALTLGIELIYQQHSDDTDAGTGVSTREDTALGALLMANYALPKESTPFPMAVTGMLQHIDAESDDGQGNPGSKVESTSNEIAFALLTNPMGDTHFGLNAEISYLLESTQDAFPGNSGNPNDNDRTIAGAIELIAVIP